MIPPTGFTLSSTATAGNRLLCQIIQPTPPTKSVRFNTSFDEDIIEVYIEGAWLRVCHNDEFDLQDADVLCKQVGYSAALKSSALIIRWVMCTV